MCAIRASVTLRSVGIARWRMNAKAPGVCEPSSIFIKGGLGTISSSRCQTTRARPGEPGRARIFSNFWTSSARKSAARGLRLTGRRTSGSRKRTNDRSGSAAADRRAPICKHRSGGARRDRTDDLLLAKQALSQLSYGPFRDQKSEVSNQKQNRKPSDY